MPLLLCFDHRILPPNALKIKKFSISMGLGVSYLYDFVDHRRKGENLWGGDGPYSLKEDEG